MHQLLDATTQSKLLGGVTRSVCHQYCYSSLDFFVLFGFSELQSVPPCFQFSQLLFRLAEISDYFLQAIIACPASNVHFRLAPEKGLF